MKKTIVSTAVIILSAATFVGVQVQTAQRTVKEVEGSIYGNQAGLADKTYMHNVGLRKRLAIQRGSLSIYNTKRKSRHWVMDEAFSTNIWEKIKDIPCVEVEYANRHNVQSEEDYYLSDSILSDYEEGVLDGQIRNIDEVLRTPYQLVEIKHGQRHDIILSYYYDLMRCIRLAALKCLISLMSGASIELIQQDIERLWEITFLEPSNNIFATRLKQNGVNHVLDMLIMMYFVLGSEAGNVKDEYIKKIRDIDLHQEILDTAKYEYMSLRVQIRKTENPLTRLFIIRDLAIDLKAIKEGVGKHKIKTKEEGDYGGVYHRIEMSNDVQIYIDKKIILVEDLYSGKIVDIDVVYRDISLEYDHP